MKDDEYFCQQILFDARIGHRDDVASIQPRLHRALAGSPGKRRQFEASLLPVELTTLSGLYVRTDTAYRTLNARLDRVVSRTVRGLYFCETHCRLPIQYEAGAWSLDGFPRSFIPTIGKALAPLWRESEQVIGERVFTYRFQQARDAPPHTTVWYLTFYEKIAYVGITLPPDGLTPAPHVGNPEPRRPM
jgi:hypothetical protein